MHIGDQICKKGLIHASDFVILKSRNFCSVLFCCHYPTRDPQGRLSLMEQGVDVCQCVSVIVFFRSIHKGCTCAGA